MSALTQMPVLTHLRLNLGLGNQSNGAGTWVARAPALKHLIALDFDQNCDMSMEDYTTSILNHVGTLRELRFGHLRLRPGRPAALGRFFETMSETSRIEILSQGPITFGVANIPHDDDFYPISLREAVSRDSQFEDGYVDVGTAMIIRQGCEEVRKCFADMAEMLL